MVTSLRLKNLARLICASLIFIIGNSFALDNLEADRLLSKAEQIKSSSPYEFNGLIEKIKTSRQSLSESQQYHLAYLIGYQYSFKGDFTNAISTYNKILEMKGQNEIKYKTIISLVNIYAISKNWNEGIRQLSNLTHLAPSIRDDELRQLGIASAALIYNQLSQYELGLSFTNQLFTGKTTQRNYCVAHSLKLESLFRLHRLQPNSPEIIEGINACQEANEPIMESAIDSYLATLYIQEGRPDKAIEILNSNLETLEVSQYAPYIAIYHSLLAQAHFDRHELSRAKNHALQSLEYAKGIANSESGVNAYKILYQINKSQNDSVSALYYHELYAQADKAYLDDIKTKHLAFQLAEHQAAEQKSRIALLDRQNNLLLTEQQLAKTQAENTRLFISLLIAIITLLGFWAYKSWTIQKRLKQLAEFDALTHVFNRGHFTQVAQSALAYCESSDVDLSYILFDLDNFKQINDKYGHAVGDWVLKKVAKACQAQGRKNDIFARIGGEEFCIALPGCDLQTAIKLAECCRKAIANIDCSETGHDFEVTASFGITDTQMSGFKLERLINDADSAMYQSKETGRDRICVFDPEAERAIPKASHTVLSL